MTLLHVITLTSMDKRQSVWSFWRVFWSSVMNSNDSFSKRKKAVGYLEISHTVLSSLLFTSPNILVESVLWDDEI